MDRSARGFAACAAALLALATLVGALAAHALAGLAPSRLAVVQTAVQYQFFHALGLLGIALWLDRWPSRTLRLAGLLLASGIVLFSGSLYALATGLSGPARSIVGVLTPLGGLCLILAWVLAAVVLARGRAARRMPGD
jgi:uncharacterized membrane protein YgdD (TMEM256/DUF423 family)